MCQLLRIEGIGKQVNVYAVLMRGVPERISEQLETLHLLRKLSTGEFPDTIIVILVKVVMRLVGDRHDTVAVEPDCLTLDIVDLGQRIWRAADHIVAGHNIVLDLGMVVILVDGDYTIVGMLGKKRHPIVVGNLIELIPVKPSAEMRSCDRPPVLVNYPHPYPAVKRFRIVVAGDY